MIAVDVVWAVSAKDENGQIRETSPDDLQKVVGCAVDPVQVLEHDHATRPHMTKKRDEPIEDAVAISRRERLRESVAEVACDVGDGRERAGRNDRITRAPESCRPARKSREEGVDEGGLADARFTSDQHEPTRPAACSPQQLDRPSKQGLTFQDAHGAMLLARSALGAPWFTARCGARRRRETRRRGGPLYRTTRYSMWVTPSVSVTPVCSSSIRCGS